MEMLPLLHYWYNCHSNAYIIMILTYDVGTTEGRYNGHCSKYDPIFFTMLTIMYSFTFINAPIQIGMFIVYLYYW